MRIWEDLSASDYQQITLMCNDTKAVDQQESDLLNARSCPVDRDRLATYSVSPWTSNLSTDSTILKYHRLAS
jgi:hypothetical protein